MRSMEGWEKSLLALYAVGKMLRFIITIASRYNTDTIPKQQKKYHISLKKEIPFRVSPAWDPATTYPSGPFPAKYYQRVEA